MSNGYELLSKKYKIRLIQKTIFTKKVASDYLKVGEFQRWARCTMPVLREDNDDGNGDKKEWDPKDPAFSDLELGACTDIELKEIMDIWASSILNDYTLSLVVDCCSSEPHSCAPLKDCLEALSSCMAHSGDLSK